MEFLVLGPLEIVGDDGRRTSVSGSKERTVLAALVAQAGLVVSTDDLIDQLWGDAPPRTARRTLGIYVSRLRKALGSHNGSPSSDVMRSTGGGYALDAAGSSIDAVRFEQLTRRGRDLLNEGEAERAAAALDEALALWRGAPYQDVEARFAEMEAERLWELRRSASEVRIDALLVTRTDADVIAQLEAMVREEPLREHRWAQLMLALYREGRQAEALNAYRRARATLAEELGVDPGPALRELHAAVLGHDPTLRVSRRADQMDSARPSVCPYKGLAAFEVSDAKFFFGREQLIDEATAVLASTRFLALVGASGTGKSSLLRAGVLYALGRGAVSGSEAWTTILIRPGTHPLAALTGALERVGWSDLATPTAPRGQGQSLLVAIDQFEELFTQCSDPSERTTFLDRLTAAATTPDGSVGIIVAMRADLYARCAEHRSLAALLGRHQVLVGPMTSEELRRAVELPAQRAGLEIEPALIDALVDDVTGRPGALPLLSTELLVLWRERADGGLRVTDYLRSGGVQRAVVRLAEEAYAGLDTAEADAARRILLRMADVEDDGAIVSRRVRLDELELDRNRDLRRALDVLLAARLVVVTDETAEVAHEALFSEWPRLLDWIEQDAEGRRLHRRITKAPSNGMRAAATTPICTAV